MNCADFKSFLERALVFRSPDLARDEARAVRTFFPILESYASKKVADLAKAIKGSAPSEPAEHSEIAQASEFLQQLSTLLGDQAKSITADLLATTSALKPHSGSSFETLSALLAKPKKANKKNTKPAPPVREEVIARYLRRLEEALGDDSGFNAIFDTLQNGDVTPEEMSLIAKRFSNSTVKSRPSALKKILARHQALMVDRAKSAATAGRIAG